MFFEGNFSFVKSSEHWELGSVMIMFSYTEKISKNTYTEVFGKEW